MVGTCGELKMRRCRFLWVPIRLHHSDRCGLERSMSSLRGCHLCHLSSSVRSTNRSIWRDIEVQQGMEARRTRGSIFQRKRSSVSQTRTGWSRSGHRGRQLNSRRGLTWVTSWARPCRNQGLRDWPSSRTRDWSGVNRELEAPRARLRPVQAPIAPAPRTAIPSILGCELGRRRSLLVHQTVWLAELLGLAERNEDNDSNKTAKKHDIVGNTMRWIAMRSSLRSKGKRREPSIPIPQESQIQRGFRHVTGSGPFTRILETSTQDIQ